MKPQGLQRKREHQMTTAITTPKKLNPIQQHLVEEEGFYFARVTMYRQGWDGYATDIVDVHEGFIKTSEDSGIVWYIRPEANMRSRFKKAILTVDDRLISIEKAGA